MIKEKYTYLTETKALRLRLQKLFCSPLYVFCSKNFPSKATQWLCKLERLTNFS